MGASGRHFKRDWRDISPFERFSLNNACLLHACCVLAACLLRACCVLDKQYRDIERDIEIEEWDKKERFEIIKFLKDRLKSGGNKIAKPPLDFTDWRASTLDIEADSPMEPVSPTTAAGCLGQSEQVAQAQDRGKHQYKHGHLRTSPEEAKGPVIPAKTTSSRGQSEQMAQVEDQAEHLRMEPEGPVIPIKTTICRDQSEQMAQDRAQHLQHPGQAEQRWTFAEMNKDNFHESLYRVHVRTEYLGTIVEMSGDLEHTHPTDSTPLTTLNKGGGEGYDPIFQEKEKAKKIARKSTCNEEFLFNPNKKHQQKYSGKILNIFEGKKQDGEKVKGYKAKREFLPSNGLLKLIETRDYGVARSSRIVRRKRGNNFPESEPANLCTGPSMETTSTPEKIEFSKFNFFRNFFEGKINDSTSFGAAKKQFK